MKKWIFTTLLLISAISLSGCSSGSSSKNTTGSKTSIPAVSKAQDNEIDVFGTIESTKTEVVVIKFPAYVETINVKEGQSVKKGDVIAKLNLDDYNALIKDKESSLSALKENKDSSNASKQAIDALANEITIMKNKLMESYISKDTVVSDMENGVVSNISYFPGDYITPNTRLLTLSEQGSLIVKANVPEEYIDLVQLDQSAKIIPTSRKNTKFSGEVSYISNKAIEVNGQTIVPIEITITDKSVILKPGFNVEAYINIMGGKKNGN